MASKVTTPGNEAKCVKIGAVSKPGRVGVVGLSSDGVGGCHFLRTLTPDGSNFASGGL